MMSWQPYWSPINNEVVENNFLRLLATKVKMLCKDYYITGSTGLIFHVFISSLMFDFIFISSLLLFGREMARIGRVVEK